ncbi:Extracellular membrane protein, CFEM domain protein [Ophiocordyceps sinensis CO18]|uniref:Extracellular membrane protein, CFEM domain protein n=1 Tax=Ophiocordyceps sinensis (strain Co18 / CGMCC 3.14243) TaxID=911162 RepID=T5AJJ4_OPHSC|nr:Extracellular membrane protein, CFEM domain protein [Ophiocordyceps sinensis CO18]
MGRFVPLILGAWSALQVIGAIAQHVPACIPGCANQLRSEFAKFSCKNAEDAACLCRANNFVYGVRDCGTHCGANDENVHHFLLGSFCAVRSIPLVGSPIESCEDRPAVVDPVVNPAGLDSNFGSRVDSCYAQLNVECDRLDARVLSYIVKLF